MKKSTLIYALTVSALGISAGIYCVVKFIAGFSVADAVEIVCFAGLLILCRSLPLYVSANCAIDMSFISILTIMLLEGPETAAALYLITTPLVVEAAPPGSPRGTVVHIFNTSPVKTLFNTANLVISILVSGFFYTLLGGVAGEIGLPGVLLPIAAYIVVSMLVNTLLMAVILHFEAGARLSSTLITGFGQFLPNILCAAPLGYFLALLFSQKDGIYLAALFMLPLLLARYSFKLYVDGKQQQYKIINALSAAIEAKDPYTVGHSKRVELYSELLARRMRMSDRRVETIKIAALFHDIGKIGIGDSVLNKNGALTPDERKLINTHPDISAKIIEDIDFYGDIKQFILCHHERYDGGGYPNGRRGTDMPIEASIIAVADAYDAMTSDRPYRKGFESERAVAIIKDEAGKQFHPRVAEAMQALYEEGALAEV